MKCYYCNIVEGEEEAEIIYQDNDILAFVSKLALVPGQVTITTKEHFTIFEQLPKKLVSRLSTVSNKLSISIFDGLQCQGTNILVNNGLGAGQTVPHFSLQIIPRKEGDGLDLQWEPQKLEEYDMDDSMIQISSLTDGLVIEDHDKEEVVMSEGKTEVVLEKDDEDNYLLKSLKRRP